MTEFGEIGFTTHDIRIAMESILQTDSDGTQCWRLNGKLHRENDPAIIFSNGTKVWYRNGELHCEDGPAIERADGYKEWWLNGKQHREDGPAIEHPHGTKCWYLNNKLIIKGECPENWDELVLLSQVEQIMDD